MFNLSAAVYCIIPHNALLPGILRHAREIRVIDESLLKTNISEFSSHSDAFKTG